MTKNGYGNGSGKGNGSGGANVDIMNPRRTLSLLRKGMFRGIYEYLCNNNIYGDRKGPLR